jgi:hypothetical protein
VAPYIDTLPGALCERILAATSDYAEWHFNPPAG